ncbi:MAG: hypothetical protein ACL7BU_15005 [Candidatus Phlomobacter fragariae]
MMLKQLSIHSFCYRDFNIIKLPRKTMNPITRYHFWYGKDSLGKFDAMAQAIHYIDRLIQRDKS